MNKRILLEKYFGIPIWFERNKIFSGGDYEVTKLSDIVLSEINTQTINSELMYPETIGTRYSLSVNENSLSLVQNSLKNEIIMLHGTLLGIEYAKTTGRRATGKYSTLIQVMYGSAFIILHNSFFDKAEFTFKTGSVYIVKVKVGQCFVVPPNMGYTVVNSQLSPLVFHKITAKDSVEEPVFDNHKGAAYYVIYKNSKPEKVINPYFRDVSKPKEISSIKLTSTFFNKCLTIPDIFNCLMCKDLDPKLRFVLGIDEFVIDDMF
ncbi:hypothetical protein JW962_03100 [Candidatus Dojkabacteria bacterium]|nr:hypothetical protein [Candidatus Dojkabacteria bacterium]